MWLCQPVMVSRGKTGWKGLYDALFLMRAYPSRSSAILIAEMIAVLFILGTILILFWYSGIRLRTRAM